jgi:diguanylate cyclase (GGDEF)-like protein
VTYYDLDNFKAYNDAYGFDNGNLMIKLTAEILLEESREGEVVGHIGGDDFIVIGDYADAESFCQRVIDSFAQKVLSLYSNNDVERGYIISKNRNGVTENFPIATISIGGVTSDGKKYNNTEDFSKDVAKLKKISKKHSGSCYHIV